MIRRSLAVLGVAVALVAAPPAEARTWPAWLKPCGTARCGTFSVPLDRAAPEAGTIGLNVLVIPAAREAKRRPEALTAIAGGPGGASTHLAAWVQTVFFDASQREDLVLVDQRGTGGSKPLFCPSPATLAGEPTPEAIRRYWSACLGTLAVDPRLLTTAVAADDLDAVREELGYPRLDVVGTSYGATAAQYYLLRHGDRVRTLVLDGATLLDVPIFERWAPNAQQALDRLFARCAAQKACRRAFPSPARDLRTLLARLDRAPVKVNGTPVTRDDVAGAVQTLSRAPASAARIPLFLHIAATRGLAGAIAAAGTPPGSADTSAQLMARAIQCYEPWARMGVDAVARLGAASYLGPTMVRAARASAAACSAFPTAIPVPGEDRRVPSPVPALVVVGEQDPQDPAGNVAGVKAALPNATVLLVRGAGHGALSHGCTDRLANAFVARASIAGLDTRCVRTAPLTPFALR